MSQTTELLTTLKKYLKAKGMSYRQLAEEMGLSETSVKRLFSQESFSLKRIETVCKILDLDLFELAIMAKKERNQEEGRLSIEQERELAADPKLTNFFCLLVIGTPLPRVVKKYNIPEDVLTQMLLKLDRIGVIELHTNNKFRMLVTKNIFWNKNGPLWKLYEKEIREDFVNQAQNTSSSCLEFCPGQLSNSSIIMIQKKIADMIRLFNELAEMDNSLPIKDRKSTALHIVFRPWVFSLLMEGDEEYSSKISTKDPFSLFPVSQDL